MPLQAQTFQDFGVFKAKKSKARKAMLRCYTKDNDQEFEEIYNLAMSLTVENDHATVVRATSSKF